MDTYMLIPITLPYILFFKINSLLILKFLLNSNKNNTEGIAINVINVIPQNI